MRLLFFLLVAMLAAVLYWKRTDSPPKTPPNAEEPIKLPSSTRPETPPKVEAAFPDDLDIRVTNVERQGRYLLGKIVGSNGEAIPRCLITTQSDDGAPPFTAVARQDGSFYIMAPPGFATSLRIEAADHGVLIWEVPDP